LNFQKNDTVLVCDGTEGIVKSKPFKMHSYDPDYYCVVVEFEEFTFPVDVRSIIEIRRGGNVQLSLFD